MLCLFKENDKILMENIKQLFIDWKEFWMNIWEEFIL